MRRRTPARTFHPAHAARLSLLALAVLASAPPASAQAPAQPAPKVVASLTVAGYDVEGNTLLQADVIQARLDPMLGRRSMAQLREAAAAVQDLYRRAGFGGVVAFVPEQTLQDGGRVKIRVVEGKLQRVEVSENQHFTRDNVLASLPALQVGRTPEVRVIDAQIQMANENPAKQLQVLLQPGSDPASIAAKVTVKEGPVQRLHLRLDNTGGERTGRARLAAGWQHADLTGRDDVLSLEATSSPGHWEAVRVLSAGYRLPFYAPAMALDAYAVWSDVDGGTTQTAAGDLAFSGRGRVVGARLSQYLQRRGNVDQRLQVGLDRRDYLNDCRIAGLPEGACGTAGVSVSVQPITLAYTLQAQAEERVALSAQLSHNAGWGGTRGSAADFEAARAGARPQYTVLRVAGSWTLPVLEHGQLELRGALQASGKPLIPGEAFGLGGATSIRGFEERELIGDSGLQAGAELSSPNYAETLGLGLSRLQLVAFVEGGVVQNHAGLPCQALGEVRTRCRMGAAGLGLRAAQDGLQLRLDVGHALTDAVQTRKGDWKLHLLAHFSL